jgi:aminotransferase in exopolysaccharide biosynthesis
MDCIDSTLVSSVGQYVDRFEKELAAYSHAKKAVAIVNGTSALHLALKLIGVQSGDEVITQAFTFVATANAIAYCNAEPVFLDVDPDTMGLSPNALRTFLESDADVRDGKCFNRKTGKRISACVPMHSFGFMCRIDEIKSICDEWSIPLVEDAAEALGSSYKGVKAGNFGALSAFSFNGNKVITSGGGGAIVSNDMELGEKAKYLSTTAKKPHAWEYFHDELAYNYRMPNLNAALLCAQMELLDAFILKKKDLYSIYQNEFGDILKAIPEHTDWNLML